MVRMLVLDYLRLWFFLPTRHMGEFSSFLTRVFPLLLFPAVDTVYSFQMHPTYLVWVSVLITCSEELLYVLLSTRTGVSLAMIATMACLVSLILNYLVPNFPFPVGVWQMIAIIAFLSR